MDTLGTHRVHISEYRRSGAILIFLISWGPLFGFFDGNLWISYYKTQKGGPHEIRKIKIAVDLWYSLWWTLWVPKVSMSSFEKIHYWEGWKLPGPQLLKRSWPCPFKEIDFLIFCHMDRPMIIDQTYLTQKIAVSISDQVEIPFSVFECTSRSQKGSPHLPSPKAAFR